MVVAFPVVTPGMSPAKVGAEEGSEDFIAVSLIVVGTEPDRGEESVEDPAATAAAIQDDWRRLYRHHPQR